MPILDGQKSFEAMNVGKVAAVARRKFDMRVMLHDFDALEYFFCIAWMFSHAHSFPTMQNFFLTISRSNSTATAWVRLNHVGVVLRPPHFTPQFNFAAASTNIPFGGLFIIFRRCVGAKPKKKFECRHRCASKIFGTTFQRVFISGRRKKGFRDILK